MLDKIFSFFGRVKETIETYILRFKLVFTLYANIREIILIPTKHLAYLP